MDKIELIKEAIAKAQRNESKLTEEILQLPSFSSAKIKHLLNNLGAISTRYLEIGLHKAGTFISTLYNNDCVGVGVDNWTQFEQEGVSKQLAYQFCEQYLIKYRHTIIDDDCFTTPLPKDFPFDMYNYDGEHGYDNQKKGITHFVDKMQDEFILTVDDFSWEGPKKGTYDGIKEAGLTIMFEQFLWDGKENSEWHNGIAVFLLKKTQP